MTSSFEGLIFPFCKLVKVSDSSTEGGGFESSERHFKNVKGGPWVQTRLEPIIYMFPPEEKLGAYNSRGN